MFANLIPLRQWFPECSPPTAPQLFFYKKGKQNSRKDIFYCYGAIVTYVNNLTSKQARVVWLDWTRQNAVIKN